MQDEQSIASKSPISRFLMVALHRRLDECKRYLAEFMYDVITETLLNGAATRYRVLSNASRLSYGEALDLLRIDHDFRSFLTEQLNQSAYSAFRWETPSIQTTTRSRDFEFVLLDYPSFTKRQTDTETYKSYFAQTNDENGIVSFANLGGDATLIDMPNNNRSG